jgi:hypothetical protein
MHSAAEPTRLSIRDILDANVWVSSEDGQKVFDAISARLIAGERVSVSFSGREQVITAFLNVAIGQLYAGSIPWNELEARLAFEDLGDGDREKVNMVAHNAKRFFQQRNQSQGL